MDKLVPLPDTFPTLTEAGYRYSGQSCCTGFGAVIEWFRTPRHRKMPFSLKVDVIVGEDALYLMPSLTTYEPHLAVCPEAFD
jgi:hypothetical protein